MVAEGHGLDAADIALIAVSGGIGFLARRALRHFYPGTSDTSEQIDNMVKLMEAGRRAGAKRMVFRMTSNADLFPKLGDNHFSIRV